MLPRIAGGEVMGRLQQLHLGAKPEVLATGVGFFGRRGDEQCFIGESVEFVGVARPQRHKAAPPLTASRQPAGLLVILILNADHLKVQQQHQANPY